MAKTFFTLILDSALERAVYRLWHLLSEQGIYQPVGQRHRPHVTLAGFDLDDPSNASGPLKKFCQRHQTLPIRLHHIGIFPERSVLFLQPRMTGSLMKLHREVVEVLGPELSSVPTSANFAINSWTPHCTLAYCVPADEIGTAIRAVQDNWCTMDGHAIGIGAIIPPSTADLFQCSFGG